MRWSKLKSQISLGLSMSSLRLSQKSKSKGRTTRWLSTREISSERNSSRETKSLLCFMRKSRFRSPPWKRVRSTTKRKCMISWISGKKFPSWRGSSLLLSVRPLVSQIWRGRSTCYKKSILSSSRKQSISSMSLRSHSMFIDGESLSAQTLKRMRWSKRSSHSRKGLLPRRRKYPRRTFSFKRKKSYTSS